MAITVASSVTYNSSTSLTVEQIYCSDYFVRVENNDGGAVRSSSAILSATIAPVGKRAGSLGTISAGATQSFTLLAYDDDNSALLHNIVYNQVVYTGFTLSGDSSVEQFLTETGSTATTTYSFTIRATDNDG